MWVYIVQVQKVCIKQDNLAKQNFSRVSRRKALPMSQLQNTVVSICPDSSHSNHVQGTCIISQDAQSQATRENSFVFNCLNLHTLSLYHTTLTIKSHNKYMVQKTEHNYNQIWHGIRANKTNSCKLQLYNNNVNLFSESGYN